MNARKIIGRLLSITGFAVSLSSIAFMAYVFFVESIFGHYVLYYEPDRALAFFELMTTFYGGVFLVRRLRESFSS